MKKYKARAGAHFSDEKAQIFGKFLEAEFANGGITPHAIVEKAKDPTCPVHDYFEWNNKKAADAWRIEQAKLYVRGIVVDSGSPEEIRAFHSVLIEGLPEYVPLDEARKSEDLWQQVLNKALQEAQSWSNRYRAYKQLTPIRKAIESTTRKLRKKGTQYEKAA